MRNSGGNKTAGCGYRAGRGSFFGSGVFLWRAFFTQRGYRAGPVGLISLFFILLVFTSPDTIVAQESDTDSQSQDIAILVRGPEHNGGLPFLQPNAIENYAGYYSFRGQEITVYYTTREIVRLDNWEPVACSTIQLYQLDTGSAGADAAGAETSGANAVETSGAETAAPGSADSAPHVYFYQDERFSIFFSFSKELNCLFAERFLLRFDYFRSVQDLPSKRPPFPAIVE